MTMYLMPYQYGMILFGTYKNLLVMDMVFPADRVHPNEAHNGIDLRAWMATQFMAGMISAGKTYEDYDRAADSVRMADELIAELNKEVGL